MKPAEADIAEAKLRSSPEDTAARIKLIGYYFKHIETTPKDIRRAHILWLIEHNPDSEIWTSNLGSISKDADPEGYEEAKNLWITQADTKKSNPVILYNAANFLYMWDSSTAETLLDSAASLAPKTYEVPSEIGRIYGHLFRLEEESPEDQRRLGDKAIDQYEKCLRMPSDSITKTMRDRASMVLDLAEISYLSGYNERATTYAAEALEQATADREAFDREDVINRANTVMGLVALRSDDFDTAKQYLAASGKAIKSMSPTSPGPSMALADALLHAGERRSVIEYFSQCSAFWEDGRDLINNWENTVRNGGMPEFDGQEKL